MNERRSARLFVLDEQSRILLFLVDDAGLFVDPAAPHSSRYWILPGGGLEDGEAYEEAAVRELREETGIDVPLGACVATQDTVLLIRGVPTRCLERFFVVRVGTPEVVIDGLFGVERDVFLDYRWWLAEDMAQSGELFMPPGLPAVAATLASGAIPGEPVVLGR